MRTLRTMTAAALVLALAGCAGLNETEQRALTGTTAGAAGGALLGAIGGNAALGAVAGAGAGLIGGLVVDHVKKNEEDAYQRGLQQGRSGF
ncbi:MAG: glycine zipper family protein [Pseudomonadota bacterium]